MKNGYADFGGKRQKNESDPWETAKREMSEEGNLNFEQYDSTPFHPDSNSKCVLFYAQTQKPPKAKLGDAVIGTLFITWQKYLEKNFSCELHPRLKFDKGGLIHQKLLSLAEKHGAVGESKCMITNMD
jgi:8-oxo-dGTP pyrophosphatase MutT (NUDIX family)